MVDTLDSKLVLPPRASGRIISPRRDVVILADDIKDIRDSYIEAINMLLGELGLRIVTAGDKVEAIAGIHAHLDDGALVMTDMRMPKDPDDGNEVAKAALDNGFQVVVVSGTEKDVDATIRARCLAVRCKPMGIDDLCNLVRRAIELSNPAVGNGTIQ